MLLLDGAKNVRRKVNESGGSGIRRTGVRALNPALQGIARPRRPVPRQGRHSLHLRMNLSMVFARQVVRRRQQISDEIWLVAFMNYHLGYFDHKTRRLEPIDPPSDRQCYPFSGLKRKCPEWTTWGHGAPEGIRTSDLCLRRATLYPAELRALDAATRDRTLNSLFAGKTKPGFARGFQAARTAVTVSAPK
jgi:hypothetical protein